MSENKIEISVKDIPEIIEQLKDLEKELEFERKSKNLFINDLYKVCEMSLKLQNQLQQKENKIKEVREYITSYKSIETILQCEHSENNKDLDRDTMTLMTNRYLKVHDKILEILDKGE